MKRILKKLLRRMTANYTEVPMWYVTLDYQKYRKGIEKNCVYHCHPVLKDDEYVKQTMFNVIDYVRSHYDLKEFVEGL